MRTQRVLAALLALGLASVCSDAKAPARICITEFGAKPDTTFLSTEAIQKAIDKCASLGGGQVVFPAGDFKTGSIFLKSNVYLYLEEGATLYGSRKLEDYTPIKPAFLSFRTWVPTIQLIYGENVHDSGICGKGTIDGQGEFYKKKYAKDEGIERPHLIRFVTSSDITVRDVNLRNAGCWMQHYLACDKVRLTGLRIFSRVTANNDAIDIDGCHDVLIKGVTADSDDDGITLKSTSPRMCENIRIRDCTVSSHCNAIKLGTETNGGFRNVSIRNCTVRPSDDQERIIFGKPRGLAGIALEIVDGGIMEHVRVSRISITGTLSPIFIRLGNRARGYAENVPVTEVGRLSDIRLSNIRSKESGNIGCSITGLEGHPVEDILVRNVRLELEGAPENIVDEPLEKPGAYPECNMFGTLPAKGFFIRHARGIRFRNVAIKTLNPDPRPDIVTVDCVDMKTPMISSTSQAGADR